MNGVRSASVTSYQGAQSSYAAGSATDQPPLLQDVVADDARVLAQQRRQQLEDGALVGPQEPQAQPLRGEVLRGVEGPAAGRVDVVLAPEGQGGRSHAFALAQGGVELERGAAHERALET